ncbi:MAG: hypothetical protein GY725_13270 [bacterium]|nr:hypothetical protein [bacterium]
MDALRLPRSVEAAATAERLVDRLESHSRPLWAEADLGVPQANLGPAVEAALKSAYSAGRIVRGLENAQQALAAEERGLKSVDRRTGVARGVRVSRLLVLADDAAERFYRSVESLLRRHGPRILALRLSVDQDVLGRVLFGPDQVARLLMLEHKDAVGAVLLALAVQWNAEESDSGR